MNTPLFHAVQLITLIAIFTNAIVPLKSASYMKKSTF